MARKTFMLMAGGTGGHIFPALAVAESLREYGHRVIWLGSEDSMETRIVPQHNIPMETLAIKGVRGNGWKRKLMLPFTLFKTIQDALQIIRKHHVDCVVGFGGFVTFPGGVAAKLAGIPIVIHEQNAVAGLANKQLSRWARRVLYAFPKAFDNPDGLVGNPVRADIAALPEPAERFAGREGRLKILVMGGSLGADVLNRVVPQALALLLESERPQIYHQAGRNKLGTLQADYDILGVEAECVEFIDDMVSAYRDADLVICRAGALTIAELTAAGVGAFLVPYPHAVDDHQTANARFMVKADAGLLLPQSQLTAEKLSEVLWALNRERCLEWAKNARTLAMPYSADDVAVTAIATTM
ncbi:undecaprenyldiphospho-muramoylpentapeptide beta-N-acetylglucosaminyltransferase [Neisseria animaloris]|uniref:UDP-N-acetylglucosamine--N-acetylmuramyl-(pentapeptide) pyrophosphoryl-undecaprenol N-acetylglucosamine transferase n=1 Tax=Neisseria animaloris TaxID=326522 RepID=A0A1X3CJL1_9NEIS|nr:undecaprenyldiphospho-muramoylpentapeptide beta-N-acetylglucosaminyltransferase [Neisseria animaloris]MDO5073344.1 undecaprenyldiphospho-muramoylpentapeptide beta-N-acetylglucosaminyltransferase [Neisseria animaloris]OSI07959.1 undecaprenyldiphospho-muramoylpentapeptide beta-N-acetylglucosaminyltransferase [Neisseria animaloris]VEH87606.1 undecaprenyldiphospho-muramoylpentapeptide beta-N-acetylglucosaminyltransferase [Neisseria animaloris]VEJ22293.1 undecaprenyldiphospho-muramoylpentapeptide